MKKIAMLLFCTGLANLQSIYAQKQPLFWNSDLQKIATPNSDRNWIYIQPGLAIEPVSFFITFKQAMNLGNSDEMRLVKTETDHIGFTHYRFHQFYKSLRVISAEFTLHAKAGKLLTANGSMTVGLIQTPGIQKSRETALQQALQYFPAERYAWQSPQLEAEYKAQQHNAAASFKPLGELVWVSTGAEGDQSNPAYYALAYVFDIYSAAMQGKRIFVSAESGVILKAFPLTYTCTATNVTTNFYNVQVFSTRLIPGSNPPSYNLWNDCQTAFVRTRNWNSDLSMAPDFVSGINNDWSAAASAATSHWGTERSYSYFLNTHGRLGWNNANGGVNVYQNALFCSNPPSCTLTNSNNASFSNGFMSIGNRGNANTIDDWNSLDIIAHEFTHGVTESSFANLIYSKESGALNESFSDIFGATCHASIFGLSGNTWLVGFDRKNPANTSISLYIRNMANPNDRSDPDTYLGTNWVSTTTPTDVGGDNWGVHSNSGVQNYMYYLLTSGGSGTNDNGTPFSLIGIGITAAREIAYRALTVGYLFTNSDYAQARTAWVHAAVDLYGECSLQAIETGKAWAAVGLQPPVNNTTINVPCGTYGGSVVSLTKPSVFSLAPGCLMTVLPSNLVQYGARKVILNPGFRAQNGSKFRAYISDCRFAAY